MNRDEFLRCIEAVDAQLQIKGVPVNARPWHAFMEMGAGYNGPVIGAGVDINAYPEYEGPDLLRKIEEWYATRNGPGYGAPQVLNKPAEPGMVLEASTPQQRLLRLLQPGVFYPPGLRERLQENSDLLTASYTDGLYVIDGTDRYVYHYTRSARALVILRDGQLRMSPFIATNDPRENKDWVFGLGTNRPSGFSHASNDETYEIMYETATRRAKNRCKVVCLTGDDARAVPGGCGNDTMYARGFCHPRMWAQYAEDYKGVCLIFDRRELDYAIRESLNPSTPLFHGSVLYRNKRQVNPAMNDPFALDFDSIGTRGLDLTVRDHVARYWRELFFEKAEDWANEREVRWLAWGDSDEPHFVHLGRSLKAIIVGHAFDDPILGTTLMGYRREHDVCVAKLHWQNGAPFLWPFVAPEEEG